MFTDPTSAEMIKYASNAFLATKISYINELSRFCDVTGANVTDVAMGMGMDKRIGEAFLKPGPGFGGSCFPKDIREIIEHANSLNIDLAVIKAALAANQSQQEYVANKAISMLKNPADSTVAILGLAFKVNTDDVRYSPAINIINKLVEVGVKIKAYDPIAMENMKQVMPNLYCAANVIEAVQDADLVLILTEWPEFKDLDWQQIKKVVKQPNVFDARNIINDNMLENLGFKFASI